MDEELESFKTRIDLRAYAASQGYQEDRRNSYQGSTCLRHPASDDKIFVKRDADGHYVYFSVRDDRDNGTIVDFVGKRLRLNLGMLRRELRPWLGAPPVSVPHFASLPKTSKDRLKVETAYARMKDASTGHPYLEQHRAIPPCSARA